MTFDLIYLLSGAWLSLGLYALLRKYTRPWQPKPAPLTLKRRRSSLRTKWLGICEMIRQTSRLPLQFHLGLCAACAFAGSLVGVALRNVLLVFLLAAALGSAPLFVLDVRRQTFTRALDEQMEQTLGVLTNSYMQSENIMAAVSENLHRMDAPFAGIFQAFIREIETSDCSVENALLRMRDKYDNPYWREWCETLVQCQDDRDLKFVLPPIINTLNDNKRMYIELDTSMRVVWRDYAIIALLAVGQIPLIYVMNQEWFNLLITRFGGRLCVFLLFASVVGSAIIVKRINKPLDL